jgi:putative Holliday junction resolvase
VPDWNDVAALIDRWQPDVFVVGLPYNLDGSESPLMLRAMKFGHRLNGRFHKPSYGFDERLSSVEAAERIIDDADWESSQRLSSRRTSGHGARKKQAIDDVAAQIILENWLAEFARRAPNED